VRSLIFVFAIISGGFSYSAGAALIDSGIYTTDTNQDLQWLDLSETIGMSVTDALAANEGWRLATNTEVEAMFWQAFPNYEANRVGFDFAQYTTDPNVDEGIYTGPPYAELVPDVENFISLFGATVDITSNVYYAKSNGYYQDEDGTWRITGVLKYLVDDVTDYETYTVNGLDHYGSYSGSANSSFGTYLVRATVIPIPAAVWLFGSALAGLGWMRRKQTV